MLDTGPAGVSLVRRWQQNEFIQYTRFSMKPFESSFCYVLNPPQLVRLPHATGKRHDG